MCLNKKELSGSFAANNVTLLKKLYNLNEKNCMSYYGYDITILFNKKDHTLPIFFMHKLKSSVNYKKEKAPRTWFKMKWKLIQTILIYLNSTIYKDLL